MGDSETVYYLLFDLRLGRHLFNKRPAVFSSFGHKILVSARSAGFGTLPKFVNLYWIFTVNKYPGTGTLRLVNT